ncbi:MAG: hypothetical protein HY611_01670, partial [Elusimicrobia bacterium]|nr:hypothetical protein [Elusimicrobiota bacterium]
ALKAPFYAGAWLARLAGAEPKPVLDIFDHIADSVGKTFSGVDLVLTGAEQAVEKLAGDSGAYLLAARYALKNAAHNAASFARKIAAIQYGRILKERAAGLRVAALSLLRSARGLRIGGEGSAGVMALLRGWYGRILLSLQRGRASLAVLADKSEATRGVAVLLRSDALMILMAVTAVQLFLADALMFVVVPNYIIDVIRPQADMNLVSLVSSVLSPAAAQNGLVRPLLDFINPMLQTKVGIQGLMFTAGAVGTYLGSRWADGQKGAQRIKFWGHPSLYKASAIGNLFFWAMVIPTYFVSPAAAGAHLPTSAPAFFAALGIFLGMQFIQHLLSTPLSIAMAPVRRKQIPNDMVGVVSAAFTMVDVGLMAIGALSVGVLIDVVSIRTAVTLIAAGVTLTSVLEWMAPQWLRRINPEGWHDGERFKSAPSKESAKPVRTAFLPVAEPALVFAV